MRPHEYRNLILRATAARDSKQLDLIVAKLIDAERAHEILRAKGHGGSGMTGSFTASLVPDARVIPL